MSGQLVAAHEVYARSSPLFETGDDRYAWLNATHTVAVNQFSLHEVHYRVHRRAVSAMSTFVLVHGAWHGSWCWDRVVPHLHAAGHRTVVPTLTGLGERAYELTSESGSASTSTASLPCCRRPPSRSCWSGTPTRIGRPSGRHQLPDAVERLALVDAWFGDDAVSLFDLAPDRFREAMEDMAAEGGDGWRIPPPPAETVGA